MITRPVIYTEEFVTEELKKILDFVLSEKETVYLGEVFENLPYPRQCFSEWEQKFKDCLEISDTIKRIREILESRVNTGALKNKLNPAMAKFNLINNYDWKEKNETETKGEHQISINISKEVSDKYETPQNTSGSSDGQPQIPSVL